MKVVFTSHAAQRLAQRAHMKVSAGKDFVKLALNNPNQLDSNSIRRYREKNWDPNVTIVGYKHLMFVVEVHEIKCEVITVLINKD